MYAGPKSARSVLATLSPARLTTLFYRIALINRYTVRFESILNDYCMTRNWFSFIALFWCNSACAADHIVMYVGRAMRDQRRGYQMFDNFLVEIPNIALCKLL